MKLISPLSVLPSLFEIDANGICRFAACIEYDGTDFFGFQRQAPNIRTVQGEIETALMAISNHQNHRPDDLHLQAAGRTDRGVHASCQVVAFNLKWEHECERLVRAINSKMAKDVSCWDVVAVSKDFNPRFAVKNRSYTYRIWDQTFRSSLHRRNHWHFPKRLDVEKMQDVAALIVGTHNFGTFGTPPGNGTSTERQIYNANWTRCTDDDNRVNFHITGNAFLYHMVRNLVGTMVQVGIGKMSINEFQEKMAACNLAFARMAPPEGLTLDHVELGELRNVVDDNDANVDVVTEKEQASSKTEI